MTPRKVLLTLALVAVTVGSTVYAQMVIQPGYGANNAYRVRVVNEMGIPVRVKIISFDHQNYFQADLSHGQSKAYPLWGGDRGVCVWDRRSGSVILASSVFVDRSGVLRLRPVFGGPAPMGAAPKGAAPKAPTPKGTARKGAAPAAAQSGGALQIESD